MRLGHSLLLSAGIRVINAVLGFSVAIALARFLGAAGYGFYSTVYVLATVCAIIVQFGMPSLMMRETAKSLVAQDWNYMGMVWKWAGWSAALLSVFILLISVSITLTYFLIGERNYDELRVYALAFATIPVLAFNALRAGALRGLKYPILAQTPEMLIKPGVFLSLVLWYSYNWQLSPIEAMLFQLSAAAIAFVSGAFFLHSRRPKFIPIRIQRDLSKEKILWRAAITMGLATGMSQLNSYTDIFLLSFFYEREDVGIYRVAYQVAILSLFGQQAVAMVLSPEFARLKKNGDMAALRQRACLMSRLSVVPPIALIVMFLTFGQEIQIVVFGEEYVKAVVGILILTCGQLIAAVFAASGYVLMMTGHESHYLRIKAIGALINLVFGLLLVPTFGIEGAAVSTLIGLLFVNVTAARACFVQEGIRCSPW